MNIIETFKKIWDLVPWKKLIRIPRRQPGKNSMMGNNALAQAGIPAILLGIYNRLEDKSGSNLSGY